MTKWLMLFLLLQITMVRADSRVCYTDLTLIPRNLDGSIKRSTAVRAAFARRWPCPSTGEVTGACSGWAMDHIIPLAVGGCDAVENAQWLPVAIKSCAASTALPCKDRWELRVYAKRGGS